MAHTLQQLIDGAKALADMENEGDDAFVSLTLWKAWINQGCKELQRLLISSDPDSFFTTVDFTLTTGNEYTLPATFLAIRGLTLNPGQSNRQTIHKFQFGERDKASSVTDMFGGYLPSRRYRVVSRTKLIIEPKESAAGTYRLYYIAEPAALDVTRTFAVTGFDQPGTAGPGPSPAWLLTNSAFTAADVGRALIPAYDAPNEAWNIPFTITDVFSGTAAAVTPDPNDIGSFTSPPTGAAYTISDQLDVSLDRFAEYIMIVAAIKAVAKEEGDISELIERRNLMRQDIAETVNMDANEPNTIVDTSDGWLTS